MENRPARHAHPAAFSFLRNAVAQSIHLLMALATMFLAGPLLMLARAGEAETAPVTKTGCWPGHDPGCANTLTFH
jgi:hypothetical protein